VPFDVDTLRTTSSGPRQQWNAHIWNNDLTLHEFNITDSGSTPTKKEHTIYVANNKINSLEINRHSDFTRDFINLDSLAELRIILQEGLALFNSR
jgi:hypothetical protein